MGITRGKFSIFVPSFEKKERLRISVERRVIALKTNGKENEWIETFVSLESRLETMSLSRGERSPDS